MITIILATYNRAALLPRAIDSVIRQSVTGWELVVVDDGSTDDTRRVIEPYLSADPARIVYYCQENSGLALARNSGIMRSRGDFLTFLDSDDEFTADHLERRLEYYSAYPETELLHGGVQIVGGPDFVRDVNDPHKHIALADCFIGGTFFMRRYVFEKLEGFRPPDFGTDYEFAQRALPLFTVRKTDAPTYIYHRETPDSLCNLMESSCDQV